jgi:hypothetical protein
LRKYVSGYTFSIGGGVVSWSSKKQATVATSTCGAEYMAACHASKEAIWLRNLLLLLGYPQVKVTDIFSDNIGTITIINNPAYHACSKHIDSQHHYVCKQVQLKELCVTWIPSNEMITDILAKALPCLHMNFSLMDLAYTIPITSLNSYISTSRGSVGILSMLKT